jgi:hypothetical protein
MSDNGAEPKEEGSKFISTWAIEWKDKVSHVVNTQKETDYPQALGLFNELTSSGKEVVLYEIRTSISDPSAQPKKIPILNSAKAKKRASGVESRPRAAGVSERISNASKSARTSTLKDLRTRILILVGVIAVFIIILFLISIFFTGSDLAHNFSIFTFSVESSTPGLKIAPVLR